MEGNEERKKEHYALEGRKERKGKERKERKEGRKGRME